jgi:hypothetical protein
MICDCLREPYSKVTAVPEAASVKILTRKKGVCWRSNPWGISNGVALTHFFPGRPAVRIFFRFGGWKILRVRHQREAPGPLC